MAATNLVIVQGKTFSRVLRLAGSPFVYKAITGITKAAPAVVTSTAHGLLAGQRAAIVSVKGMTQINAKADPPDSTDDYRSVTVIDANSVSFNDINSSNFTAYASGGYLQYLTPTDLAGATARMSIKDKVGGTELLRLDTTTTRIVVDNTAKKITLTIDAVTTAAITWSKGTYDLELVNGAVVTLLLSGSVSVVKEVTNT